MVNIGIIYGQDTKLLLEQKREIERKERSKLNNQEDKIYGDHSSSSQKKSGKKGKKSKKKKHRKTSSKMFGESEGSENDKESEETINISELLEKDRDEV